MLRTPEEELEIQLARLMRREKIPRAKWKLMFLEKESIPPFGMWVVIVDPPVKYKEATQQTHWFVTRIIKKLSEPVQDRFSLTQFGVAYARTIGWIV